MSPHQPWQELYRGDDLNHMRMIATCLDAMEFEARLIDLRGRPIRAQEEFSLDPPYCIHVPGSEWGMLTDVLGEIIDEQRQFDARFDESRNRAGRRERQGLVVLIAIVIVLAMFGLIEL